METELLNPREEEDRQPKEIKGTQVEEGETVDRTWTTCYLLLLREVSMTHFLQAILSMTLHSPLHRIR